MGPVRWKAYSGPIIALPHRLLARVFRVLAFWTL